MTGLCRAERIQTGREVAEKALHQLSQTGRKQVTHQPSLDTWACQQATPLKAVRESEVLCQELEMLMCPSRNTKARGGKIEGIRREAMDAHAHNQRVRAAYRQAIERGEVQTITSMTPLDLNKDMDRAFARVYFKRQRRANKAQTNETRPAPIQTQEVTA